MATDPRPARSQSAFSNSPAKLPSLPTVRVTDPQMQRFVDALRVWVDSRSGARDNFEKAVTVRDLVQLGLVDGALVARGILSTGVATPSVVVQTPTGAVTMSNEAFARTIVDSRVFQEVIRRLDDPARFDSLPDLIRERLQADIAAEAAQRGADIRRIEEKLQDQNRSLAVAVDEVTAAINTSVSGVRETTFAYAEEGRAVAGKVTQIQARIDGVPIPVDQLDPTVYATLAALQAAVTDPLSGRFYQVDDPGSTDNLLYLWNGTAFVLSGRGTVANATSTIEEQAIATADRTKGLEAQYTLKVQAGGAIAGFGLAATQTADGNATSAMIIAADKFAIVDPTDTIANPLAPPVSRVPFGVDTVNDIIYINGKVRINAGGTELEQITAGTSALRVDLSNETFQVATDKDGNNPAFGAHTETGIMVLRGTSDETSLWTFNATATGCTAQMWNGSTWVNLPGNVTGTATPKIKIVTMSADDCAVTVTATKSGDPNLTAVFTGSKVKAGTDGVTPIIRTLRCDTAAVKRQRDGTPIPSSITFQAFGQTGTAFPSAYAGRIRAFTSTDGVNFTQLADPTTDAATRTVTVDTGVVAIKGELFAAGGFTTSLDRETILVTEDGQNGTNGINGANGVNGTSIVWKGSYASAPGSPENGWAYYNLTDGKSYVYQDSVWYQMTIDGADGADGEDGVGIVWKGDLASPPLDPQLNWAYRDTDNGLVYIYNSANAWELMVQDGADGAAGQSVEVEYSVDGSTWHADYVSGDKYLRQRVGTGAWSAAIKFVGDNGTNGLPGANTALLYIYRRATSAPALPSAATTYTFSTKTLTGLNNSWTTTIPAGTDPLYVSTAAASSSTDTDTIAANEWASPVVLVQNGTNGTNGTSGLNVAVVMLYRRTTTSSAPAVATTGSTTYTFATGAVANQPVNWTKDVPSNSNGAYLWVIQATASATTSTDSIANTEWTTPVLVTQDGANGTNGTNGTNGERGSLTGYGEKYGIYVANGSPPVWSSAKANRVINNMLTGEVLTTDLATTTHLRVGDTVTLVNVDKNWAETRYWGGTSWLDPGVVIDGNLLVNGTVSANAIYGTTLSAIKTNTGTLVVDTSGYIRGGQTDYATGTGFFLGYSGGAYKFSVGNPTSFVKWDGSALQIGGKGTFYGIDTSNYVDLGGDLDGDIVFIRKAVSTILPPFYIYDTTANPSIPSAYINTTTTALQIVSSKVALQIGSQLGITTSDPLVDVIGNRQEAQFRAQAKATSGLANQHAARFYAFNTSNAVVASGVAGEQAGRAFYGEVGTIAPFTGSHDGLILLTASLEVGDILVDGAVAAKRDVSNTLFEVAVSSAPNQHAIGIYVQSHPLALEQLPAAMLNIAFDEVTGNPVRTPTAEFYTYKDTHAVATINALGEGQINVCGEGGDVQPGDLIVTSSMPGKGMRQADDIIRSYTVAKAREAVTFSSPTEVKQVACIYLCG